MDQIPYTLHTVIAVHFNQVSKHIIHMNLTFRGHPADDSKKIDPGFC